MLRPIWLILFLVGALAHGAARADEGLVLYGAGSLRGAISEIAAKFTAATGTPVRTEFGPSGLMRERIERGEHADLFTSADIGHLAKLLADGRAASFAMFTRNALCGFAMPELGLTTANFVDKMLDPAVRIGTSTPRADPSGDYTWAVFRIVDEQRAGAFATLDAKARQLVGGRLVAPGEADPFVMAFAERKVDMFIGYCSGRAQRQLDLPGLQVVAMPDEIAVGPEYGLAVLKDADPRAAALGLFVLSPEGQAMLAAAGFAPIGLPTPAP